MALDMEEINTLMNASEIHQQTAEGIAHDQAEGTLESLCWLMSSIAYSSRALVYAILDVKEAIDNIPGDTINLLEDQDDRRVSK